MSEILTIGHSTHPEERFLTLLEGHGVKALADVRRFPSSRRHPQFNADRLDASLAEVGVDYARLGETLGGRRSPTSDSPNAGWRVGGFQGYADHMSSSEFQRGLEELQRLGEEKPTAVMCAEGPWWRCHRQLIADALLVRGWSVTHVMPDGRLEAHRLTPFAVVEGDRITYPPRQGSLGGD